MALALVLVASLMLFFVFNSGRAVNQKINLVNAADAAAYSGAQITARQLNFMAYTNRAMIANEVSVGHMFSYQMELDVVSDLFQNMLANSGGFLGDLIIAIINIFVPGFSDLANTTLQTLSETLQFLQQLTDGVMGFYALMIDANNAFYSSLQQEAFRDFAYPEEGRPLVEAAMLAVLKDYESRPSAPILLNDEATLAHFVANGSPAVQQLAVDASDMHSDFCKMILFVSPNQTASGNVGDGNQVDAFCESVASGGGGIGGAGTADDPMTDNGVMLDMLRTTLSNMENATWINDRDMNYRGLLLTQVQRRGETKLTFDSAAGEMQWSAENESLRVGDPLFNFKLAGGSVDGNIGDLSEEAGQHVTDGLITTFETWGLCGDGAVVDCSTLAGGRYAGTKRYTYLNSAYTLPRITAFVSQSSCGDNIGVDDEGQKIEGWHNNLHSFEEEHNICDDTVYAVAQAEVFFERPACVERNGQCEYGFKSADDTGEFTEQPNLFNPFWQARIVH